MPTTIRDVARITGLSVSTVSKALNGYGSVRENTRELVRKVAGEIGYYPNSNARALKTNRSYNIGIVFSDEMGNGLVHGFFAALLDEFKRTCELNGYDVTFINHRIVNGKMTYLDHCRFRNVDGVCVVCADYYSSEMNELMESEIPCISIDHVFGNRSAVLSDNEGGMRKLVKYAVSMGHSRIAYIHGQENSSVTELRLTGFRRAMSEAGLPVRPEYLVPGLYDNPDRSPALVRQLLSLAYPPTCILVSDDHSALGVIRYLQSIGIRPGPDLSIAGYDGSPVSRLLQPRLTTIVQDSARMGTEAADILMRTLSHPEAKTCETRTVPVSLFEGETICRL